MRCFLLSKKNQRNQGILEKALVRERKHPVNDRWEWGSDRAGELRWLLPIFRANRGNPQAWYHALDALADPSWRECGKYTKSRQGLAAGTRRSSCGLLQTYRRTNKGNPKSWYHTLDLLAGPSCKEWREFR